jgi:DNA-directed RNA polymerase specialized sigma subunit, sigma24 homolog
LAPSLATNRALGSRRKTARLIRLDLTPERAGPGDLATEASTRIALLDGIADLPLQIRAAIVLRYYADLSVEEVAATLGKSPNTIKAQLQTALDRLRVHLADPVGTSLGEARHA